MLIASYFNFKPKFKIWNPEFFVQINKYITNSYNTFLKFVIICDCMGLQKLGMSGMNLGRGEAKGL